jgi:hypothetical protein
MTAGRDRIRLFDRVFEQDGWAKHGLSKTDFVIVDIQNVSDYQASFGTVDDDRPRTWVIEDDCPNVTPPFPWMWTEYHNGGGLMVGVFVCSVFPPHAINPRITFPENAIGVQCDLYFGLRGSPVQMLGSLWYGVDKSTGKAVPTRYSDERSDDSYTGTFHHGENLVATKIGLDFIFPTFLAMSFMHCKNVTIENRAPDAKLSRAYSRRHGVPLVRYYVLNIDPMRKVLREEGNVEHVGLKQALHICRGHFKTYTPEKPLLGRTVGTFWWPMHVRGTAEAGVSLKDYCVKAPRAGEEP